MTGCAVRGGRAYSPPSGAPTPTPPSPASVEGGTPVPQAPVSPLVHTPRLQWLRRAVGVRGRGGPWEAKVGPGSRRAFRGSGQHRVGPRVPCCGVRPGFGAPLPPPRPECQAGARGASEAVGPTAAARWRQSPRRLSGAQAKAGGWRGGRGHVSLTSTPTGASPGEPFFQRKISNTYKSRPNSIPKS